MKNKLRIFKSIFLVGTGLTLAHTISYNLCANGLNVKPFEKNEYDLYRTDISYYSKDGVALTSKYQNKEQEDYLVIKKESHSYFDMPYTINSNYFSEEQINFIIQNIDNMELLINEDYIKSVVKEDVIENFDEYSFEYIHFDIDKSDVQHYASNKLDKFALIYHLVLTTVIFAGEVIIYKSMENAYKTQKTKRLTKNDKKI